MDILAAIRKRLTPTQIRYFSWLIGLYLIFAILNAFYQTWDAPRSQVNTLFLANLDVELRIQTPKTLTFDGQRRQGRIELSIKPRGNTPVVSLPSVIVTSPVTSTLQPISPLSTQPIPKTSCSRFMSICLSDMGTSLALPAPASITPTLPYEESDGRHRNSTEEQEWSFLVSSTDGAYLISSDGVSFTPIITLSISSNITAASFLIEHAALPNSFTQSHLLLEDLSNRQSYSEIAPIHLESRWQLYVRRFLETFVSLGSVFALIVVGIEYLQQEQKERADQERTQTELRLIVDRLPTVQTVDIPSAIKSWAQLAKNLREPSPDLLSQVEAVRETSQRLVIDNAATLADGDTAWVKELEDVMARFANYLDNSEDVAILKDLLFVVDAIQDPKSATQPEKGRHSFADPYLAGIYLDFAWDAMSENDRQLALYDLDRLAGQDSSSRSDILQQVLLGIYTCDEQITPLKDRPSLRKEVGEWYSNLDIPIVGREGKEPHIPEPGSQFFSELIAKIAGTRGDDINRNLLNWCRSLQAERISRASRQQQQQRVRRPLWPLPGKDDGSDAKDANYNYRYPEDEFVEYWNDTLEELNQPYHHYVQGMQDSGKSWLRIHFEKIVWLDNSSVLPVFYFPPIELLYWIADRAFIYRTFARSVANCLVAALLESYKLENSEIQAVAPFLARYGYSVPLGESCLAAPTPPLADLDEFYANTAQSYRLAQIRSALRKAQERDTDSDKPNAEQILDDVSVAIREAGFTDVYLFVDNLTRKQEEKLWPVFHSPEIGADLQRRGLYLKTFGVLSGPTEGWPRVNVVDNPVSQARLTLFQQYLSQPF